ncbi:hypothetical protein PR048_020514 [Dryococelus australis]|uniref:Uncharacterized protein n=1 Tax=Dryococelus australis TaxID=614101 RepID=A0ABQ9H6H1_9NEOP|nr:hypothetical protein PR048_020514 [Dryococelus australis]
MSADMEVHRALIEGLSSQISSVRESVNSQISSVNENVNSKIDCVSESVNSVSELVDRKIYSVNENVDRKIGVSELVNNKIDCVDKMIDSVEVAVAICAMKSSYFCSCSPRYSRNTETIKVKKKMAVKIKLQTSKSVESGDCEKYFPFSLTDEEKMSGYPYIVLVRQYSYETGATVVERLDCSPPTNADRVQSPAGSHSGFSQVGSVTDDAGGRRVFSRIFRFPRPFIPASVHTHLNYPHRLLRPC